MLWSDETNDKERKRGNTHSKAWWWRHPAMGLESFGAIHDSLHFGRNPAALCYTAEDEEEFQQDYDPRHRSKPSKENGFS